MYVFLALLSSINFPFNNELRDGMFRRGETSMGKWQRCFFRNSKESPNGNRCRFLGEAQVLRDTATVASTATPTRAGLISHSFCKFLVLFRLISRELCVEDKHAKRTRQLGSFSGRILQFYVCVYESRDHSPPIEHVTALWVNQSWPHVVLNR